MSQRYFENAETHLDPLVANAATYAPTPIVKESLRRPRNVLIESPILIDFDDPNVIGLSHTDTTHSPSATNTVRITDGTQRAFRRARRTHRTSASLLRTPWAVVTVHYIERYELAIRAGPVTSCSDSRGAWPPEGLEGQQSSVRGSSLDYVAAVLLAAMAAVLLAAVGYHCAATWRWFMGRSRRESQDSNCDSLSRQATIRISHSLPDLQTEPLKQEYVQEHKDAGKKVLRQTTLPIVPTRHQTFQRQLSHRLDLPSIQFSICSLERADSSIGLIKPELYKNELVRQSSTDSGELEFCGKLHFALKYDQEVEALVVKIFEARDLPIKDVSGSSDPYIKVFLLPDRKKKFQTKVHRKNLNPVFNETFLFSVPYEELRQRYLQFSVYDFDRFSRHDLIGHVVLKGLLESADLTQEIEYTMNILAAPQEKKDLGELMLSLCYLPTAGRLTVTVIKGRNLKAMDINGSSDPYVKVSLICQGKRIKKKKTTVKKNTLSPVYNEALVFDLPYENVYDVTLLVKVIDYDMIGSNELIGCTAIGSTLIGIGRDHWLEMLDNSRKPVAQWYPLNKSLPTNISLPSNVQHNAGLSCLNGR